MGQCGTSLNISGGYRLRSRPVQNFPAPSYSSPVYGAPSYSTPGLPQGYYSNPSNAPAFPYGTHQSLQARDRAIDFIPANQPLNGFGIYDVPSGNYDWRPGGTTNVGVLR